MADRPASASSRKARGSRQAGGRRRSGGGLGRTGSSAASPHDPLDLARRHVVRPRAPARPRASLRIVPRGEAAMARMHQNRLSCSAGGAKPGAQVGAVGQPAGAPAGGGDERRALRHQRAERARSSQRSRRWRRAASMRLDRSSCRGPAPAAAPRVGARLTSTGKRSRCFSAQASLGSMSRSASRRSAAPRLARPRSRRSASASRPGRAGARASAAGAPAAAPREASGIGEKAE